MYLQIFYLLTLSFLVARISKGDIMDIRHHKEWIQIGLNILHYRKEQRLTQEQLADLCGEEGISRNYIQKIETAASSCSLDTLIDIAKALKVPLCKLFEFKE